MRYVIELAYHGARYGGWQAQPNALTVQALLDEALSTLLRAPVSSTGAGRTDAGVHARQLFAHFDAEAELPPRLLRSLNGLLPPDIAAQGLWLPADPAFHCRFDALSRAYVYQIALRKSPLLADQSWWVRQPLDLAAMEEASKLLLDYQDFASFCKAHGAQKTTRCALYEAQWQAEEDLLRFHIRADRFLRGMVRGIVGTLVEVGRGRLSPEGFGRVLEQRDRRAAAVQAEAQGLCLTEVRYAEGALRRLE
jgi:tRNA pseudouridine38-40 synthase